MIVTLHMSCPAGEAARRFITRLLNELKNDNRLLIEALLNNGVDVPDTVGGLGVEYNPRPEESHTPHQQFYSMADMMERGTFSCGDAAAYEAAVLEEKHGIAAHCSCVAQGSNQYHAIFYAPWGPVDPTENWILEQGIYRQRTPPTGANRW